MLRPGMKVPGKVVLITSGALTLGGVKLFSVDMIFDAKSLATVNVTSQPSSVPSLPPETVVEVDVAYDHAMISGFPDGTAETKDLEAQIGLAIKKLCTNAKPVLIMTGRFDRRELRRALLQNIGSNWALADSRAAAVARRFRLAGCESVTLVAPPTFATNRATPGQMTFDRSVTVHAYFVTARRSATVAAATMGHR